MKLIIIILSLSLISFAAAQSAPCFANFTLLKTIMNNLNTTYYIAYNFTNPKLPLTVADPAATRDSIDNLNQIAINWTSAIINATVIIQQVFGNFSVAIKDNNTADYPDLFDKMISMIEIVLGGTGTDGLLSNSIVTSIPTYSQTAFQYFGGNFSNQFNSTSILLSTTKAMVQILINSNVDLTPANASNYLMTPAVVNLVLSSLNNLTINYMNYVKNVTQEMNNTYNIYKYSDTILNQLTTNYSMSVNNISTMFIKTYEIFSNASLSSFTTMNASIDTFIASTKAAVQSDPNFIGNITAFKKIMGDSSSFVTTSLFVMANGTLDTIVRQINSSATLYYNNIVLQYPSPQRSAIFKAYLNSGGNNSCSNNLVTYAAGNFTAFGGAKAYFNCTDNEQFVYKAAQIMTNSSITAILLNFNTHITLLNRCNTIKTLLPDGKNYNVVDCVGDVISAMSSLYNFFYFSYYVIVLEITLSVNENVNRYLNCMKGHNDNTNFASVNVTQMFQSCAQL